MLIGTIGQVNRARLHKIGSVDIGITQLRTTQQPAIMIPTNPHSTILRFIAAPSRWAICYADSSAYGQNPSDSKPSPPLAACLHWRLNRQMTSANGLLLGERRLFWRGSWDQQGDPVPVPAYV